MAHASTDPANPTGTYRYEATPAAQQQSTPVQDSRSTSRDAGRERYTFDAQTGSVKQHGPVSVQAGEAPASASPLDNARDGVWHSPVSKHAIKPDSIVTINGIEGDVAGFEKLGVIEKGPDGQYRMAEAKPQQQQQQEQAEPRESLPQEIEGTISKAVDILGQTATHALFIHASQGNDVAKLMPELAARTGMEPEQAQATYDKTVAAFVSQAQSVASKVGVSADAWDGFVEWAHANKPAETHKAQEDHFLYGRTGGISALAKEYAATGAQWDADAVLNAELGGGITTSRDGNGKVILNIPGHGTMPYQQAVSAGIIRISHRGSK